jgi:DNA (cytosine-5)-methyltransferase 1
MAGQGPKAGSIAESSTTSPTLRSASSGSNQVPTVAYSLSMDSKSTLFREQTQDTPVIAAGNECKYVVRRLMPVECERLQGFPDGWTDVEAGGNPALDSWRYKVLGNSMTVNVMHWIGARLQAAVDVAKREAA